MAYIDKYGIEFSGDRKTLVRCPEDFKGNYIVPDSVTSIEEGAFFGCSGLTNVIIPNSVTFINWWTFQGCSSLTSVCIPNSVTNIGMCAFKDCVRLTNVNIPDSVKLIQAWAFSGCASLTRVSIPNSVTSIGEDVFVKCRNLKEVKIIGEGPLVDILKEQLPSSVRITIEAPSISQKSHTCRKCGCSGIPADALFCPECGTKLS